MRLRLGGRTSNNFSTWVEFEGYSAYGFLDERFKFGLATRGFISKEPRLLYRASYKHDVEQLGQSVNAFRNDNLLGSVFRRNPNTKLTDVEEWKVSSGAGVVRRIHQRGDGALSHPTSVGRTCL
jgi:hypothetical protein